jgi:hypothetical protein
MCRDLSVSVEMTRGGVLRYERFARCANSHRAAKSASTMGHPVFEAPVIPR